MTLTNEEFKAICEVWAVYVASTDHTVKSPELLLKKDDNGCYCIEACRNTTLHEELRKLTEPYALNDENKSILNNLIEATAEADTISKIEKAYNIAIDIRDGGDGDIEEIIGLLGEVLE